MSLPDFVWVSDVATVDRSTAPRRVDIAADDPADDPGAARVPGEAGLWVFVLTDMSVFGLFFLVFSWEGRHDPAGFTAGAASLSLPLGVVNTLTLLLSSYLVVLGVRAHRSGDAERAVLLAAAACGCAAMFAALKVVEWTHEIRAGHTPGEHAFPTFYFVLTGLHLLHVLIGSGLLGGWIVRARSGQAWPTARGYVEGATVYWHMVDLLWVVIFTLVYLVHLG